MDRGSEKQIFSEAELSSVTFVLWVSFIFQIVPLIAGTQG
jgi:hypothetical protein